MRILPAIIAACVIATPALAIPFTLPDVELLDSDEFYHQIWESSGGSSLDGRADLAAGGVGFLTTLGPGDDGKMIVGDNWPVGPLAGLLRDEGVLGGTSPHNNSSLHIYDSFTMHVSYLDGPVGSTVSMALYMNTGLTGSSGWPSSESSNNTAWSGPWVEFEVGDTALLELDFLAAEAMSIEDNPEPHTGGGLSWPNGGIYAINDRDLHEITNIGIMIADFNGDTFSQQLSLELNVVPEPATIMICLLGAAALAAVRRKR